jgi:hypothetical protein
MSHHFVSASSQLFKEPLRTFLTSRLRQIRKSRVEVSREVGKSLSYLSQVESGLVNFNQEMVELYCRSLRLEGDQANDFKQLVAFSNSRRKASNQNEGAKRVAALIELFGDSLDEKSIAEIETSISAAITTKRSFSPYRKSWSPSSGGGLTPDRFLELIKTTDAVRQSFSVGTGYCNIVDVIEEIEHLSPVVKITFHKAMPRVFGDVYACVENLPEGIEFHFQEEVYTRAFDGCWFSRHVLAHEVGHYILRHRGVRFLQPQIVQKGATRVRTTNSKGATAEEQEADIAGTLLLVPWRIMFTRPSASDLSSQYRSDPEQTSRLIGLFSVPAVRSRVQPLI